MNKKAPLTLEAVSLGISELMPNIIRGIQLDFFADRNITQTQFLMIVAISSYGRCRMSVLAQNMKIKMPTATGIADRLVKAGYVCRFTEPNDRRVVLLELTEKGSLFFGDFRQAMRRRWEEVLRSLKKEDLRSFHQVIAKLRDNLKRSALAGRS